MGSDKQKDLFIVGKPFVGQSLKTFNHGCRVELDSRLNSYLKLESQKNRP